MEIRYGDCTVKPFTGGHLAAAMKNLEKFNYAGTRLGTIRITGQFMRPLGEVLKDNGKGWRFVEESSGESGPYRQRAADLVKDIKKCFQLVAEEV